MTALFRKTVVARSWHSSFFDALLPLGLALGPYKDCVPCDGAYAGPKTQSLTSCRMFSSCPWCSGAVSPNALWDLGALREPCAMCRLEFLGSLRARFCLLLRLEGLHSTLRCLRPFFFSPAFPAPERRSSSSRPDSSSCGLIPPSASAMVSSPQALSAPIPGCSGCRPST